MATSESVVALQPRVDTVDQLIQAHVGARCAAQRHSDPDRPGDAEALLKAARGLWACYTRAGVRHGTTQSCDAYLAKLRRELSEYRAIIAEHAPACTVLPFRRREG